MFGYEKVAISETTGRENGIKGISAGGTLFLEEIGVLFRLLQAKLLIGLKNREFEKIGGNKPVKVDLQIKLLFRAAGGIR